MESNTLNPPAALARHVARLWPLPKREELVSLASAVRAMGSTPGWLALTAVLDAEVESIDRSLSTTHKALDHADYALLHGRRAGLRAIHDAARAILDGGQHAEQELDNEDAAEPAAA